MPPRGRKPKPNALHLVLGTNRIDRHGDAASEFTLLGSLPDPPPHLDKVARAFWKGLSAELSDLGLGFRCEQWDVEHVSMLYARARAAELLMPNGGFYEDDKGNPRRHPAAIEALACRKELRVALEGMGISASGRARLLGNVKPWRADPADGFFQRRGG